MKRFRKSLDIFGLILFSPVLLILVIVIGIQEVWEEISETYGNTSKEDDL